MRGGRITAQQAGVMVTHRDIIYARMCALPEGALFTQDDVTETAEEIDDFALLRGHDYVHVVDGYFTRIIETTHLRRLPRVMDVIDHYSRMRGIELVETGDRAAWRLGIKQWEPILGYRFHSSGADDILSLGHMKIRIISGPEWARDPSQEAMLFRCFYDQPLKDIPESMSRAASTARIPRASLKAAADFGFALDAETLPADWLSPHDTAEKIMSALEPRED